jgi:ABC-type sugar transport system substrate-binding protein
MSKDPVMLSRRSLLSALGGLALVSPVLAACGSGSGGSGGAGGGGASRTIGLSLNGVVDYTKYVAEGVAMGLDGGNYQIKVVQANFDGPTELRNIESLVSQGVSGIVVNPNTIETTLNGIRDAKDSDIPSSLAIWAGSGPLDPYLSGVAFLDSVKGGSLIGEWLKANARPGKIIVVQGVVGQGFSERIDEGLDNALKGSGFEVVVREQGLFDRNTAVGVVERGLQAHPDAKIVVSYAAAMGDGIAAFLKQNNITDVTHVTSDADEEMLTWLGTPYLSATRFYSAAETGVIAAKIVRTVVEGGSSQFQTVVFQDIMTAQNKDAILADHPIRYPQFASRLGL